jgi:integrase
MAAGHPPQVVQAQLGHSTLAMTERYSSADERTVAGFVEDWGIGGEPES